MADAAEELAGNGLLASVPSRLWAMGCPEIFNDVVVVVGFGKGMIALDTDVVVAISEETEPLVVAGLDFWADRLAETRLLAVVAAVAG